MDSDYFACVKSHFSQTVNMYISFSTCLCNRLRMFTMFTKHRFFHLFTQLFTMFTKHCFSTCLRNRFQMFTMFTNHRFFHLFKQSFENVYKATFFPPVYAIVSECLQSIRFGFYYMISGCQSLLSTGYPLLGYLLPGLRQL